MSKVLFVAVVLLVVGFPLLAQQESQTPPAPADSGQATSDQQQLTPDQKKELEQKMLYVEQGAVVLNSEIISPVSNSHFWDGRQGLATISESDFYQIAGLPKAAAEATSYRSMTSLLLIGGALGELGAGILEIAAATVSPYDRNYNSDITTYSVAGAVVGLVALVPGIIGIKRLQQKWSPAQEALKAADDYNAKLVGRNAIK